LGIVIPRTREGTSLMDQFKWRVHPLGFSKGTREGTSLVDLWLVKDFTRLKRNLKNRRLLRDWM